MAVSSGNTTPYGSRDDVCVPGRAEDARPRRAHAPVAVMALCNVVSPACDSQATAGDAPHREGECQRRSEDQVTFSGVAVGQVDDASVTNRSTSAISPVSCLAYIAVKDSPTVKAGSPMDSSSANEVRCQDATPPENAH